MHIKRRHSMKVKKIVALTMMLLITCISLCGCAGCGGELSEAFDKETLEATAKEVMTEAMVNGVEDTLTKRMRADYLEDYPLEEVHGNLLSLQSESGEFLLFEKVTIRGEKSPTEGSDENFAIVLTTANFEKGDILFYITFDEAMNVVGFHVQ